MLYTLEVCKSLCKKKKKRKMYIVPKNSQTSLLVLSQALLVIWLPVSIKYSK